jgi:hypothetical protein
VAGISSLIPELARGKRLVFDPAVKRPVNNWLRATGVPGIPDIFGVGMGT